MNKKAEKYKGLSIPNLGYWYSNPDDFGVADVNDVCILKPSSSDSIEGLCSTPYVACTGCLVSLPNFDIAVEYMFSKDYISISRAFDLSMSGSITIDHELPNKSKGESS